MPSHDYDFPDLRQFLTLRFGLLRYLRRRFVIGYIALKGGEEEFLLAAYRNTPLAARWFRHSIDLDELDTRHGPKPGCRSSGDERWQQFRSQIRHGDEVYPFAINPDTLAMRLGYVVVRNSAPVAAIVVVNS